jgi:hypothetical protein
LSEPPSIPRAGSIAGAGAGDGLSITT